MLRPDSCRSIVLKLQQVMQLEAEAVLEVAQRISDAAAKAVELIVTCQGRLVLCGIGKAGLVARKAAATFSSTGTPAFFLHPTDALHGDLGGTSPHDVVLALSNSGETEEILRLVPSLRDLQLPIIAITGNTRSRLSQLADAVIDSSVSKEAGPGSVAPTCSSTAMMALCDALALVVMEEKGLDIEDFVKRHPGGWLGKKLGLKVSQCLNSKGNLPLVGARTTLRDVIVAMSSGGMGAAIVIDAEGRLIGIFTDGDLRRTFERVLDPLSQPVEQIMTRDPVVTSMETLAARALEVMEDKSITVLPIVDESHRPVGILHLHDLVRLGFDR